MLIRGFICLVKMGRNRCQSVGSYPPDDVALAAERPGLVIHVPVDSETEAGIEHVQSGSCGIGQAGMGLMGTGTGGELIPAAHGTQCPQEQHCAGKDA